MTILIRGGGDLASGVALRLFRSGFPVVITELPQPLAVRRAVSFAEAVYEGQWDVEGVHAQRVDSVQEAFSLAQTGVIPVLIAPELAPVMQYPLQAVVDARLLKTPAVYTLAEMSLLIGLGPGFTAGQNCHAVVETMRGHTLGRVYWQGAAIADNGQPEGDPRRVLRASSAGVIRTRVEIGTHVEAGEEVAVIDGRHAVVSQISGVLRGIIRSGLNVPARLKIGDVDPRDNRDFCFLTSDKALAVGGGVLEAILSRSQK